jgi:hypothetical protein
MLRRVFLTLPFGGIFKKVSNVDDIFQAANDFATAYNAWAKYMMDRPETINYHAIVTWKKEVLPSWKRLSDAMRNIT